MPSWFLFINDKLKGVFPSKLDAWAHFSSKYPGFGEMKDHVPQRIIERDNEDCSISWNQDLKLQIRKGSFEKPETVLKVKRDEVLPEPWARMLYI